jgi:cytochrome c oxidase subunit 3
MNETTIAYPGEEGFFGNLPWGKLMMWVFLASDVMGFASLIAGYFYLRMLSVDWPDSGELLNVMLTSINTVFLLSSSFTMAWAVDAIKRNDQRAMLRQLGITIFLGTLFLLIQGYEYFELFDLFSETFDERPFSGHLFASTFFLLTGFHAFHVFVGLVYLGCISVAAARGRYSAENYLALDIAGLFWHFVDWVWVAVFLSLYII